jgi:hypothetical protein
MNAPRKAAQKAVKKARPKKETWGTARAKAQAKAQANGTEKEKRRRQEQQEGE